MKNKAAVEESLDDIELPSINLIKQLMKPIKIIDNDPDNVLFVVEMLRYGDREAHSYVIGVYSTREMAETAGKAEVIWRGHKYEYVVSVFQLDYIPDKKLRVLNDD